MISTQNSRSSGSEEYLVSSGKRSAQPPLTRQPSKPGDPLRSSTGELRTSLSNPQFEFRTLMEPLIIGDYWLLSALLFSKEMTAKRPSFAIASPFLGLKVDNFSQVLDLTLFNPFSPLATTQDRHKIDTSKNALKRGEYIEDQQLGENRHKRKRHNAHTQGPRS